MRKKKTRLSDSEWRKIKASMPIPCVDMILENKGGKVLLGWRLILPYRNVWALPGGRVLIGENLTDTSRRILGEYHVSPGALYLVGVFPVNFTTRSDISICLASRNHVGEPNPDGHEFSRFKWCGRLPKKLGANYVRMILKWRAMSRDAALLKFGKIA